MTRRFGFVLVAAILAATTHVQAQEEDTAQARELFSEGVTQFEQGDYRAALASFQEAYRLRPHPSVRVNMANCYEQLERPLEAMFHYERFLAESEDAEPGQRQEVEAALERLGDEVGEVTLRIQPDGARVTIDGTETRRAPILEPMRMTEGVHTLAVTLDGFETAERQFIVEGGQPAQVTVTLERAGDAPAVAAAEETAPEGAGADDEADEVAAEGRSEAEASDEAGESADALAAAGMADDASDEEVALAPEDESSGFLDLGIELETPTLIAGAATGGFLVGALVTGVVALGAQGDFDDAVAASNDPTLSPAEQAAARQEGLDASDRADAFALVTDVLLVGALVGAGVTAYLYVTQEPGGTERAEGPQVTPVATPHGAGLVLSGAL